MEMWTEFRRWLQIPEITMRAAYKEYGLYLKTLRKILELVEPSGYRLRDARGRQRHAADTPKTWGNSPILTSANLNLALHYSTDGRCTTHQPFTLGAIPRPDAEVFKAFSPPFLSGLADCLTRQNEQEVEYAS